MNPSAFSLAEAWTGGQYSAVRTAAAGTLATAYAAAALRTGIPDSTLLLLAAASLALAAGVGRGERVLAALVAVFVSFAGSDVLGGAAAQFAGFWLSMHLLLPLAPYGSVAARGREDPRGTWGMPRWYPACAIALLVFARAFSAVHALVDGHVVLAGLFFFSGMLVLHRSTALAGWMLSLGLGLALWAAGRGSVGAAWFLHLATFQPAWIARPPAGSASTVFYDGGCALCHGVVRFVLAEDDPAAPRLRLAPLGGATFAAHFQGPASRALPDSVVVLRDGEVLLRSAAAIAILEALGGWWAGLAAALTLVPRAVADRVYDMVAARRHRWFGRKAESCPRMPAELRSRIDP